MDQLELIQSKIHEIRGQRVMLDFDLSEMYNIETKYLKRAVRNNIKRFPIDFMFELTREEWDALRCKICTSNTRGGTRYMPFAFTEQGVAMLSSVLNSDIAIEVNIGIMRAFVAIRQMATLPKADKLPELERRIANVEKYIEEMFADQNDINEETRAQLDAISMALAELQVKNKELPPRRKIGFRMSDEERI